MHASEHTRVPQPLIPQNPPTNNKTGVCVLEFWATWCGPCQQVIPHMSALQRRFAGRATFVGVSLDDDVDKLRRFVSQQGDKMAYAVVADASGAAQRELFLKSGARGVPHCFVLDAAHRVAYSGHPLDPQMLQKLQAAVDAAAGAGAGAAGAEAAGAGAAAGESKEAGKKAVPPVKESLEELLARPVRELKALLRERGVAHADCLEKADLARRIVERCSNVTHYV